MTDEEWNTMMALVNEGQSIDNFLPEEGYKNKRVKFDEG